MIALERDEYDGATYYRLRFSLRGVGPWFEPWYEKAYDTGWRLRNLKRTAGDILWGFYDGWRMR